MQQQSAAVLRGSTASQPPPEQHTHPSWAGQLVGALRRSESNHPAHELLPPGGMAHANERARIQGPSAASSPLLRHQQAVNNNSMGIGGNPHHHSSSFAAALQRSLLDLPEPWLLQLVSLLDTNSLLALFRACVRLRNFIMRHSQRLTLTLLPSPHPRTFPTPDKGHQQQSLRALQLAEQHGSNWKLRSIRYSRYNMSGDQAVADYTFTTLRMAHSITAVTQLVLHGLVVEVPLMPWLSDILPNLTKYTLSHSFIQWPSTSTDMTSSRGTFTKLRSLEMIHTVDLGTSSQWRGHITQQVKNLTALKRMAFASIHNAEAWSSGEAQELFLVAALPSTAQQLTTLTLQTYLLEAVWQQVLSSHFAALQELQLPCHILTDQDMPWLLGLPQLKWLQVSEPCLDQSWAGHVCGWQELYFSWCSTVQLARLPLHSNLHLKGTQGHWELSMDLGCKESIQAAITAVSNSQLPEFSGVEVRDARDRKGDPICLDHGLKQAAPLLVGAKYVCLPLDCLTVQGILAWLDAMPAPKQAMCLQLEGVDEWPVSDVEQLCGSLPAGISIVLLARDWEDVVDQCCLASSGITLHVMLDEQEEEDEETATQPDIQVELHKRGKQDIHVVAHDLPGGSPWEYCVTAQHITAGSQPSSQRYANACASLNIVMGCILQEGPKRFVG